MTRPSRDDVGGPSQVVPAPPRGSTPLPGSSTLTVDPSTTTVEGGAVVMGGAPLRLWRLTPRAQAVVARWREGAEVGPNRAAQLLARRLVSAGAFVPQPGPGMHASNDVTIVIPVRDRPQQLQRLLVSLEGHHCVVVDDGSADRRCCDVAEAAGAEVVMLADNQGPAAARNAGLARVTTSLVAFLDSDCLPQKGWLEPLLDAFDDALVAAVAPRIVPAPTSSPSALARYETIRSSLDRGPDAGLVRPQSAIPYVPSATLVVRRAVAGDHLFDPRLRSGEDVDLVWRLGQAGWDVRYVPASLVEHDGPTSLGEFLAKRASYGGSAGPLAQRHPDVMAPLHASAWSVAAWLLAVAKRPVAALGVVAASTLVLTYRLRRLVQDPVVVAGRIAGGGTARSALPALAGLTRAWSPAMLIGLAFRRTRWRAAAALLGPALADWSHHRDTLDPLTYAAFHVADDLAYGCGVWAGSIAAGTGRALWPSISWRARVWSSPALRRQLAPELP